AASTLTQIVLAEGDVAISRPSVDLKARDLLSRAQGKIYEQTPEAFAEASALAEEVLHADPSNPVAHRVRASVFLHRMWFGEIPHDDPNVARALELARTALRYSPREEMSHWLMSGAYGLAGQLEDAVAECERGLDLNPNHSVIWGDLGGFLASLGRAQEAIDACRLALRLNPRDPSNFWRHYMLSKAHFVSGDYEAALKESKSVARSRTHMRSAIIWAAAAAALGKAEEARSAVAYCLAERPDLTVGTVVPAFIYRFAREEDHERLLALLRKAG